ncbi:MAG TPA: anti-sigma factor RsbA family regulatory protein [Solirubrobacteraceae bacterium]|nr:anti-sigma factor RsbA family regulatory protein [Solirubrobacteraceae bacterium]
MAELASRTSATAAVEPRSTAAVKVALVEDSFRHEALFYNGDDGFLRGTLPYVREGLAAGEPTLVAVGEQRALLLKDALGADVERVRFVDMREVGRNPARVIPAWREFLAEHAEHPRGVRAIGEAVWPGRSAAELDECARHERLLNAAFSYGPAWHLLCPYDLDALDHAVIDAARLTHPALMHEGISRRNGAYLPLEIAPGPFNGSLPAPPAEHEQLLFTRLGLGAVRNLVSMRASEAGLGVDVGEELVLAINELATNSVQHGGGGGTLRTWREPDAFVCEVRDRGFIRDPLVGRLAPPVEQYGGRGLWLVNQLCDLVQIRSAPSGTVVRVHTQVRR